MFFGCGQCTETASLAHNLSSACPKFRQIQCKSSSGFSMDDYDNSDVAVGGSTQTQSRIHFLDRA